MKSKFKYPAYLLAIGAMLTIGIRLSLFINEVLSGYESLGSLILSSLFFIFIWFWMFFGELRTKAIYLEIQYDSIKIKQYLGLDNSKIYYLNDVSGFKTSIILSKWGSYEYLYLFVGDRKIAKLSSFYHSNYKELKHHIVSMDIKNEGFEPFSNIQELKDIFTF